MLTNSFAGGRPSQQPKFSAKYAVKRGLFEQRFLLRVPQRAFFAKNFGNRMECGCCVGVGVLVTFDRKSNSPKKGEKQC